MSILNFLSGPGLEKLEKKGDALVASGSLGQAKLVYERALIRAEKERRRFPDAEGRLLGKLVKTKEGLAAEHQKTAEDYMDGGHFKEARSFLSLAREMTENENRIQELANLDEKLETLRQADAEKEFGEEYYGLADEESSEPSIEVSPEEEFHALCATLPPEVQAEYLSCDENFRAGYLALNNGEFETAADLLGKAMTADPDPESYIPLELATAFLHLGRLTEARELLDPFLSHHPDALPAYQLLCDICWEEKAFQQADELLDSVPEPFKDSLAVVLLRGETRYHAEDFDGAKAVYQAFMENRGWETDIAVALAKAHEATGNNDEARGLYREIMGRCTGCGAKIDPAVKHKYAELSFAAGIYDTHVLEMYLALAREIPDMAANYYARVSRIYTEQGNEIEAARFRMFARQASQ